MLEDIYNRFNELTKIKLTEDSSITLESNYKGNYYISYRENPDQEVPRINYYHSIYFNNLQYAVEILDSIDECDSSSELLDYLDQ